MAGSLASLTLKHWEEELPSPAGLEVAGFEVIDFVGVNRQDGTIEISFPYQPGARDLIYRLQHSANLGSWTDAYQLDLATGVSTNLPGVNVSVDSSARMIGATISNPALLGANGFWRLVAETP